LRQRGADAFGLVGLLTKENAPARERVLPIFVERDDLDRDMPGEGIVFELA